MAFTAPTAADFLDCVGGNALLADAVSNSIARALSLPWVHLSGGTTTDAVLEYVAQQATQSFKAHPGLRLVARFIRFGPLDDEPYSATSADDGPLSDVEAEAFIKFFHATMVNRFKGDLAELLALDCAIDWVQTAFPEELARGQLALYWGDTIAQRTTAGGDAPFAKGADGLLLQHHPNRNQPSALAVFEVKSMPRSVTRLTGQLSRHRDRLSHGVRLTVPARDQHFVTPSIQVGGEVPFRTVAITPAAWPLDRRYTRELMPNGRMSIPQPVRSGDGYPAPPAPRVMADVTLFSLPQSVEELEEAAYALTYWYVGRASMTALTGPGAPRDSELSLEADAWNRVKHMLYCLILRPLEDPMRRLAVKFYNIYCFSYPLGIDSRSMLDAADFPQNTEGLAPKAPEPAWPVTYEFPTRRTWQHWKVTDGPDSLDPITAKRTLRRLAPSQLYEVGIQVGTTQEAVMQASIDGLGDQTPTVIERRAPLAPDADPPVFEEDPYVYRAPVGALRAKSDRKGRVKVVFSVRGSDPGFSRHSIARIIIALVPVDS